MYKIRKIDFENHPVLGNLKLDFCDREGKASDTIILAGENGSGKSTIIEALYDLVSRNDTLPNANVEYEIDDKIVDIKYQRAENNHNRVPSAYYGAKRFFINDENFRNFFPSVGIYSDVDINFHFDKFVSNVTSLNIDENNNSARSTTNLPTEINQLLIDIDALDNADISEAVKSHPDVPFGKLNIPLRMNRFTNAFSRIFSDLEFNRIINENRKKKILFKKNWIDVPIESLSSGEKQIVYRGCFLLKDVNSLNGAFVFIDEPEISLHPNWQKKILNYYKDIFTDENGVQTSQMFVVTHSPFIIHNENRANDKVIVLHRNDTGGIAVEDKPEYYKCDSMAAVLDAFHISLTDSTPTVFLEGSTDEKYFRRLVEVYGLDDIGFQFKFVGSVDEKGQDKFGGKDQLNKVFNFLVSQKSSAKHVCLFDCDTNRKENRVGNICAKAIRQYESSKKFLVGIENALVLDDIDVSLFYYETVDHSVYNEMKKIQHFKKTEFCDYVCSLGEFDLKKVFSNLKKEIDELIMFFKGNKEK